MSKLKSNKAFTIVELIVVIAIIAILVLLGAPKIQGYVDKANLARIQHDVRVMENKMEEVLSVNTTQNNWNKWQNNGKDLGRVVMRKELYERQGAAKFINWEHLSAKWLRTDNNLTNSDELGVGGNLIELDDKYSTYKIIPETYSKIINTRLKGTFYVNPLGKVYYEHDKSLGKAIDKEVLACVAPSTLGYEFEVIDRLGTITGWTGNATHLVIPASFKMSDGNKEWCEPVRVIGKGAFQNGNFKKVTIPQSVEEVQDEAFQDGELTEIEIPHSVKTVGDNAFTNNPATSSGGSDNSGGSGDSGGSTGSGGSGGLRVIVKGSSGPSSGRNISDSAFGGLKPNYSHVTDKDLGVITKIKIDSSGNKSVSITGNAGGSYGRSYGGSSSDSSLSNKDKDYSNTVINIPKKLEVNGELLPVTEIDSGAFQGSGLIDVIMPEGLLYIHDYAFAGNQLIRAIVPNSVIEVGNYAFAYNEIASEPTIDPINILESKFTGKFGDVNNEGNISKPVSTIDLKDHIFIISSMGNHVIEDIGANPEQSEDNNKDGNISGDSEVVAPGPSKPIEGINVGEYTFYGEVSTDELISGNELATKVFGDKPPGIENKDKINGESYSTEPWLKFTKEELNEDGNKTGKVTTMFVAKKPLRYNLSWDHIGNAGAVFGNGVKTEELDINGKKYRVRLLKGANKDPITGADSDFHNSEWNKIMLPIHEQAINKSWAYPQFVEKDTAEFIHGLGSGPNKRYTDADLLTHYTHGNGSYSWTQESYGSSRVVRGSLGVSDRGWSSSSSTVTRRGWRPVLELISD